MTRRRNGKTTTKSEKARNNRLDFVLLPVVVVVIHIVIMLGRSLPRSSALLLVSCRRVVQWCHWKTRVVACVYQRRSFVSMSKKRVFTLAEVAKHNSEDSCWMAIGGKVYDVTTFIAAHPGGDIIMEGAGIDATELFEGTTVIRVSQSLAH
jgi:predicted heme/steroid binding protein